jgi:16S rRNA (uracil1498-N3)-methyltransferase
MPPRLHSSTPLAPGRRVLDAAASRHARVLRLAAGDALTLFDGHGGEWIARIATPDSHAGRSAAAIVDVIEHAAIERERALAVHLAVGMPANDRMDDLVEKATELGAASIQPLMTRRAVLRPDGERASKKRAHWQAVAVAACEQCGRNRVPTIGEPMSLTQWLMQLGDPVADHQRWMLCAPDERGEVASAGPSTRLEINPATMSSVTVLSGPEGGFAPEEERSCLEQHGFRARSLGPRVLRADTAPLALLARLE